MGRFSAVSLAWHALSHHRNWTRYWQDLPLGKKYDVLIIGAGGHGLATAHYLAKNHGITNVAVLEKGWLGGGNIARNTVTIRSNYLRDESLPFFVKSVSLFEGLAEDLNFNLMYSKRSMIDVVQTYPKMREIRRRMMNGYLHGSSYAPIDVTELRRRVPPLTGGGPNSRLPIIGAMVHEEDDPGTRMNERGSTDKQQHRTPRSARRAIQAARPNNGIITSDIGNYCAIGNAYPSFEEGRKYLAPGLFGPCGYGFPAIAGAKIAQPNVPVIGFAGDGAFGISMNEMTAVGRGEWPAITMVIFRNYQWGAEKRNTTLWFDDNFVGTELDEDVSYAAIANAGGLVGVQAASMDDLTDKLDAAIKAQMNEGKTTFIEIILNKELGEPFRRDAMKAPVAVAGISKNDMIPQKGA